MSIQLPVQQGDNPLNTVNTSTQSESYSQVKTPEDNKSIMMAAGSQVPQKNGLNGSQSTEEEFNESNPAQQTENVNSEQNIKENDSKAIEQLENIVKSNNQNEKETAKNIFAGLSTQLQNIFRDWLVSIGESLKNAWASVFITNETQNANTHSEGSTQEQDTSIPKNSEFDPKNNIEPNSLYLISKYTQTSKSFNDLTSKFNINHSNSIPEMLDKICNSYETITKDEVYALLNHIFDQFNGKDEIKEAWQYLVTNHIFGYFPTKNEQNTNQKTISSVCDDITTQFDKNTKETQLTIDGYVDMPKYQFKYQLQGMINLSSKNEILNFLLDADAQKAITLQYGTNITLNLPEKFNEKINLKNQIDNLDKEIYNYKTKLQVLKKTNSDKWEFEDQNKPSTKINSKNTTDQNNPSTKINSENTTDQNKPLTKAEIKKKIHELKAKKASLLEKLQSMKQ